MGMIVNMIVPVIVSMVVSVVLVECFFSFRRGRKFWQGMLLLVWIEFGNFINDGSQVLRA